MNKISTKSYFSAVTIGLRKGCSDEILTKSDLILNLQEYQKKRTGENQVYLSALVSDCLIVLNNQVEPHIRLEFINYPRFPLTLEAFKAEVESCAVHLMDRMEQNRIVITFSDETVMLEKSDEIDPRVLRL